MKKNPRKYLQFYNNFTVPSTFRLNIKFKI